MRLASLIAALLACSLASTAQTVGTLVDIVPKAFSNESNQDSEPTLAVNPLDPKQVVVTVFTPRVNYCAPSLAPAFVSTNEGQVWDLRCWLPSATWTADATIRFGSDGKLYASILRQPDYWLLVTREDSVTSDSSMKIILTRKPKDKNHIIDQPYIETAFGVADDVYIGENDSRQSSPNGSPTASLEQSHNSAQSSPTFAAGIVDTRSSWFDLPPIRPVIHKDGTVYASFISINGYDEPKKQLVGDIVVARGHKTAGSNDVALKDLVDGDSNNGIRVATGVRFPYSGGDVPCCLGQQRYQANLSIAVDPNDSKKVYIAWGDLTDGVYTLHVKASADSGKTWTANELYTKPNSLNPALAVNANSTLGFLFQTLASDQGQERWKTFLERTNHPVLTLANTPASQPVRDFHPYLGDYLDLRAVGTRFYGVFSANNTPDLGNFPDIKPTYLRNHDFTTHTLLGLDNRTPVSISVDPFFFTLDD